TTIPLRPPPASWSMTWLWRRSRPEPGDWEPTRDILTPAEDNADRKLMETLCFGATGTQVAFRIPAQRVCSSIAVNHDVAGICEHLDREFLVSWAGRVRWHRPRPSRAIKFSSMRFRRSTRVALRHLSPSSMNELIFIVEEAPEGGFTARALGASIFTEA